ncbi:hypothetical protein I4N56_015325 [Pseudomonas mohnii]|uniref:gamma-mobile-trio protein GmtX n=1 Tax=Pseudomonas mohnii TaxID=395600 RepID=UPI0018C7E48A|nr:gamma-mobile-trio protein GmtX [Pseudomonas mohnii]MBH8612147.1 hypothetical protein [Pseudomonas mohnii]
MTPEALLSKLKETATTRTCKSLDAIYNTCMEQKSRKSKDFSYAMIARLGRVHGAPAYQSIRNHGGSVYRALIDSFAAEFPVEPKAAKGPYAWIENLPATSKLLARMLLAELKLEQRKLRELFPPNKIYEIDSRTAPSTNFKLTTMERQALEYLKSDRFLQEHNLKPGPRSDILGPNNEQLFKPGTLAALEKALNNL